MSQERDQQFLVSQSELVSLNELNDNERETLARVLSDKDALNAMLRGAQSGANDGVDGHRSDDASAGDTVLSTVEIEQQLVAKFVPTMLDRDVLAAQPREAPTQTVTSAYLFARAFCAMARSRARPLAPTLRMFAALVPRVIDLGSQLAAAQAASSEFLRCMLLPAEMPELNVVVIAFLAAVAREDFSGSLHDFVAAPTDGAPLTAFAGDTLVLMLVERTLVSGAPVTVVELRTRIVGALQRAGARDTLCVLLASQKTLADLTRLLRSLRASFADAPSAYPIFQTNQPRKRGVRGGWSKRCCFVCGSSEHLARACPRNHGASDNHPHILTLCVGRGVA